jgi:TPR repeat protein
MKALWLAALLCACAHAQVTNNAHKAFLEYKANAEKGNDIAQYNLAVCYADGHGVAKDSVEAVRWYRKAAEQNLAEAQSNLGQCYAKGLGVAKNETEAVAVSRTVRPGVRIVSAPSKWRC